MTGDHLARGGNENAIRFGVGCFHFALAAPSRPYRLTAKEYVRKVRAALSKLPSVDNVDIEIASTLNNEYSIDQSFPSLEREGVFFPFFHFFRASFDLRIPFRLQDARSDGIASLESGSELFRVFIASAYQCPLAYICPVDIDEHHDPSSSVVVVREFLTAELEKLTDVTLETLGPSPFHADFTLRPLHAGAHLAEDEEFRIRTRNPPGYADITIEYDPSSFENAEHAFDSVRHALANELDVFYQINLVDMRTQMKWARVVEAVGDLVLDQDKSAPARMARAWSRSTRINRAHRQLAEFEIEHTFSEQGLAHSFRDTYQRDRISFLRSFLDAEMADRPTFPTEQIGRLIKFMEERRSRYLELVIALIAAVIGGAIGTILSHTPG